MKKLKVLWIITTGLRKNGICISQLEYIKHINKDKFIVDIAAVHKDKQEMIDKYKKYSNKVILLPDRKKHTFNYLKKLKKLLKEEKYDIIHVYGSSSLMLMELMTAKRCGVKVRIAHSRNTTCDRPWLEKILRNTFNNSYNVALACGNDAGKWLFGDREFIVFHNAKDLEKYKFNIEIRRKMRGKLGLNNEIAIGHVGFFNAQKNHEFLIDAFNEIHSLNKNTKLFLMGIGFKMDAIKKKVSDLDLNNSVVFLNNVDNVEEYLQAMDVMLFPSLFEGLPNVVIEWQASGLPSMISSNITTECKSSDLVSFLSVNDGAKIWGDFFKKIKLFDESTREKESLKASMLLAKNGFEIIESTKNLEKVYVEACEKYFRE